MAKNWFKKINIFPIVKGPLFKKKINLKRKT